MNCRWKPLKLNTKSRNNKRGEPPFKTLKNAIQDQTLQRTSDPGWIQKRCLQLQSASRNSTLTTALGLALALLESQAQELAPQVLLQQQDHWQAD